MKILLIVASMLAVLSPFPSFAQSAASQAAPDGNNVAVDTADIDTSILDLSYVNSTLNLQDYDGIFVKKPEVAFQSHWINEFGDARTRSYRARIARDYANLLMSSIEENLAVTTGLDVVTQPGEKTLVIIPKLLDLYIHYPDMGGIQDVLIANAAGNAKIDLVIYSPKAEAVFGLFTDWRSTGKPGIVIPSKLRTINTRAFTGLFDAWMVDITGMLVNR